MEAKPSCHVQCDDTYNSITLPSPIDLKLSHVHGARLLIWLWLASARVSTIQGTQDTCLQKKKDIERRYQHIYIYTYISNLCEVSALHRSSPLKLSEADWGIEDGESGSLGGQHRQGRKIRRCRTMRTEDCELRWTEMNWVNSKNWGNKYCRARGSVQECLVDDN